MTSGLSYKYSLGRLNLYRLSHRGLQCDLIPTYRLLNDDLGISMPYFFLQLRNDRLR